MKFLNNIDLNSNELQNAKFHILGTDPLVLVEALFWYNSTEKKIKYYDGAQVVTLADMSGLVGLLEYKGVIDASSNPNYPAGEVGDVYIISVAGKIGGGSGEDVEAGDMLICNSDNAGGDQATVGDKWDTIQKNLPDDVTRKYKENGVTVGTLAGVVTITHNLNTTNVVVSVIEQSTGDDIILDVKKNSVNSVQLSANGANILVDVTVVG